MMEDPVVAADGWTCESNDITRWLVLAARSPLTNEPMERSMLANRVYESKV